MAAENLASRSPESEPELGKSVGLQTPNQLSQVRTWLSWFGVCLIAVKQNDDPGPWFFINSIARPMHLAQLVWVVGFQPVDQGSISVVVKSTQYRGALSQLHNALAAVQLYNSVVRGL